ncbi:MAG: PAS domain-containing protein [Mucilaginibacter sp.]|jgi:PAS domain S-box-containing protein
MKTQQANIVSQTHAFNLEVKERSDRLMDYFLACHFLVGLALAGFYGTWLIAIGVGGISILAYYSAKIALPDSDLYQYVLGTVLGIFMAQFIYQMHGLFEMHFFAFVGSALLITYQKWKLQIPITVVVVVHHGILGYLQNIGYSQVYFTQLTYFGLQTFMIHIVLAAIIFFICGLWAYQLRQNNERQIVQTIKMGELEKEAQLSVERAKIAEALEERNTILESITDAFFAVDHNWTIMYWNNAAEKELGVPKYTVLNKNFWELFADAVGSESYQHYHNAMDTHQPAHFEHYSRVLERWYEISAYPSANGLSVYFKDVTERKLSELRLTESEKRYSDLFQLSPQPMCVYDIDTTMFLDVNEAAIKHYGYSRDEFLSMSIHDIRQVDETGATERLILPGKEEKQFHHQQIYRHCTKSGQIIYIDMQSTAITYKGKQARVVLANNVTERVNYVKAVEEQNERLKEISWMQSHLVRAPLAKITALIPLINDVAEDTSEREKMLQYLQQSAHQLDEIIIDINTKSTVVEVLAK